MFVGGPRAAGCAALQTLRDFARVTRFAKRLECAPIRNRDALARSVTARLGASGLAIGGAGLKVAGK